MRSGVERQGYAVVSVADLWAAFSGPGEDPDVSFGDKVAGFAAANGWAARRGGGGADDAFTFRRAGHEPPS